MVAIIGIVSGVAVAAVIVVLLVHVLGNIQRRRERAAAQPYANVPDAPTIIPRAHGFEPGALVTDSNGKKYVASNDGSLRTLELVPNPRTGEPMAIVVTKKNKADRKKARRARRDRREALNRKARAIERELLRLAEFREPSAEQLTTAIQENATC